MKKNTLGIIVTFIMSQVFIQTQALATETIIVSGWEIEMQTDGTCAMGKLYEFGHRDAINISINSYGSISILADKSFKGDIIIDDENVVHPVNALSHSMYMYSNSDNKRNGKLLIKYFKSGNFAKVTSEKNEVRTLSLKGFTKAYRRYKKCAR